MDAKFNFNSPPGRIDIGGFNNGPTHGFKEGSVSFEPSVYFQVIDDSVDGSPLFVCHLLLVGSGGDCSFHERIHF